MQLNILAGFFLFAVCTAVPPAPTGVYFNQRTGLVSWNYPINPYPVFYDVLVVSLPSYKTLCCHTTRYTFYTCPALQAYNPIYGYGIAIVPFDIFGVGNGVLITSGSVSDATRRAFTATFTADYISAYVSKCQGTEFQFTPEIEKNSTNQTPDVIVYTTKFK